MEYAFMFISYKHRPVNMTYVKANRVWCCHHNLKLCVYSVYFFSMNRGFTKNVDNIDSFK